jgi:dolichol-phosphate mannosyltransferase
MNTNEKVLYIIVPCYNEEECMFECYKRLLMLRQLLKGYKVIFVFINDGSSDRTPELLNEIAKNDSEVMVVYLEKNSGHQNAVRAGLSAIKLDQNKQIAVAIIDADLQDGPENIPEMLKLWEAGYKNVYGQRKSRPGETKFKLATAKGFYRFMNFMTEGLMPVDTGDFRVVDQSLVSIVNRIQDKSMVLRAVWPSICDKKESVAYQYDRAERFAGTTHYPLSKMLKLALDTIFGYSVKPVKVIGLLSALFLFCSGILFLGTIISLFVGGAPLMWLVFAAISFTGGAVLLALFIIGEFVLRIFKQMQGIPNFSIKEIQNNR